jgi:cadmium resistance protein CadD (predicted permease)
MDFPAQVGAGIWAFVARIVDDLLFLMIFFANRRFPVSNCSLAIHWNGVAHRRQSLRFTHCFGGVTSNLIGLVRLFPIATGIKELLELCKNNENDKDDEELHR